MLDQTSRKTFAAVCENVLAFHHSSTTIIGRPNSSRLFGLWQKTSLEIFPSLIAVVWRFCPVGIVIRPSFGIPRSSSSKSLLRRRICPTSICHNHPSFVNTLFWLQYFPRRSTVERLFKVNYIIRADPMACLPVLGTERLGNITDRFEKFVLNFTSGFSLSLDPKANNHLSNP
jgi:hypothetical protein